MKKIISIIVQLIIIYTIGILLGLSIQLLIWVGLIKLKFAERFPHRKGKLIIIANHPSLLGPLVLVSLFWQSYLRHPFKQTPIVVVDKINIYKKSFYGRLPWIRPFCIPVDRKIDSHNKNAIKQMAIVLEAGKILFWFPEGGRTSTGRNIQWSKSKKCCIRKKLKPTGAYLAQQTGAQIFPIWFGWEKRNTIRFPIRDLLMGRLTIKIGERLKTEQGTDKRIATQWMGRSLLKLGDEE